MTADIPRDDLGYLADIVDAVTKATAFVQGMTFEAFERTLFAVVRALEIVGEAAKCIPETARRQHPEVPWNAMAGMRDKRIPD